MSCKSSRAMRLTALLALSLPVRAGATNVTTYHYDNLRTGWNQTETTLTPASVSGGNFGLLAQVPLDEQVDAQPLFVGGQTIQGQGTHDVVYIATENNTVYAIDANSGAVLLSQNFGPAVPQSALPGGCNNNSNNMGINSTPVIDINAGLLYAMTYTYENSVPTFRIHAISLATLQDTITPPMVGGTAAYKNGKPEGFVSAHNRQRAALLEANGNIYAGFASWCDANADVSRGWVLGWNAATLSPLPISELLNRKVHSKNNFFLSSVWMSGYGIASDATGSLYFVTGNSDPGGASYNSTYNLAESVVNLSADLTTVQGFFTPKGGQNGWSNFDKYDVDFGAAGVLLLPDQPGAYPHLAVAAGKSGPMYLLDRDNLGGLGKASVTMGTYVNYGCWCGQSYYTGADGVGRVVTSTGEDVGTIVWRVQTAGSGKPVLVQESTSPTLIGGQDPGFFTTISSNGTAAGTAVIWAVTRPSEGNPDPYGVYLQAMDPANGSALLYSAEAGTWPFAGSANANLVPVTANGHVFVASYANLSIFGSTMGMTRKHPFHAAAAPARVVFAGSPHELYGVVTHMDDATITLRLRSGALLQVDAVAARQAGHVAPPALGMASIVRGDYGAHGVLVASYVLHAKNHPAYWPADR